MVVEYNTEKKHTEYKIIVEDGRVSKIIVQIPQNEDVEEEEYEINSDTLQEGVTRRICYKTFKRLWSVKNNKFLEIEKIIKQTQPECVPLLSQLTFAHTLALPLHIQTAGFSCKHEICPHECTSEL